MERVEKLQAMTDLITIFLQYTHLNRLPNGLSCSEEEYDDPEVYEIEWRGVEDIFTISLINEQGNYKFYVFWANPSENDIKMNDFYTIEELLEEQFPNYEKLNEFAHIINNL